MVHHHLEVDLVLGLVHEVEGLHFVLRKRVGLGLVMVPLECNIVLLLQPQGVPQWLGYNQPNILMACGGISSPTSQVPLCSTWEPLFSSNSTLHVSSMSPWTC